MNPSKSERSLLRPKVIASIIGGVAAAILAISCETMNQVVVAPPMIPGATYVGMDQCALCHEKEVENFKLTQHSRLRLREAQEKEEVQGLGCEACHGPGSKHVDAGGGKGKFIVNPGQDPSACFQCHLDKNAEFSLQYHHPVKEGRMSCMACHNPHGEDIYKPKGMWIARTNDQCAQCHREQARPHVFVHEALREGCTICHNVHGSINDKMLTQNDNNLCLRCHGQVALPNTSGSTYIGKMNHTTFLRQGTCWSAGCHTAVHGSDVNTHLRY